jgi:hypothetical protein
MQMKNDQDAILKLRQEQKNREKAIQQHEREEFNKMIEFNTQRELDREKQNKQVYQKYENKHKNRVKYHQDFIKQHPKKSEFNWKNDGKLQELIEERTNQNRIKETKSNFNIVKQQLEMKQMERQKDAEILRRSIEQRFKDDDFNKKLDQIEKQEAKKSKQLYQDMLNRQIELKNHANLGTMTQIEKKLNKTELHGYKNEERHVQSMIPGINHFNSIGSKPT